MNLTRCCSNTSKQTSACGCKSHTGGAPAICCIASFPTTLPVGSIVDIQWDGQATMQTVRNLTLPNSHSYILGITPLPIGYKYVGGILYFPPGMTPSADQFSVATTTGIQDPNCGGRLWTFTAICVVVECLPCHELV